MTTLSDILRAAATRIEQPNAWTQGEYARAKNGSRVRCHDASASSWCALGALYREDDKTYLGVTDATWNALSLQAFGAHLETINDFKVNTQNEMAFMLYFLAEWTADL